jgi:hypothetical protein
VARESSFWEGGGVADVALDESTRRVRYDIAVADQRSIGVVDVDGDTFYVQRRAFDRGGDGEPGGADLDLYVPLDVEFVDLGDAMRQFFGDPRRLGELVDPAEAAVVGDVELDGTTARLYRVVADPSGVSDVLGNAVAAAGGRFGRLPDDEVGVVIDMWVVGGDRLVRAEVTCDCDDDTELVYDMVALDEAVLVVLPSTEGSSTTPRSATERAVDRGPAARCHGALRRRRGDPRPWRRRPPPRLTERSDRPASAPSGFTPSSTSAGAVAVEAIGAAPTCSPRRLVLGLVAAGGAVLRSSRGESMRLILDDLGEAMCSSSDRRGQRLAPVALRAGHGRPAVHDDVRRRRLRGRRGDRRTRRGGHRRRPSAPRRGRGRLLSPPGRF